MQNKTASFKLITDNNGKLRYQFFCDLSGSLEYTSKPINKNHQDVELGKIWSSEAKEHFNYCKKCGKCVISSLIELSDSMAVYISVASGGTMARKQLAEKRPALVLAVACERDLLSGIRDTLPMPVIGVINQRPEGPCVNTTVDIGAIAQLINKIKN